MDMRSTGIVGSSRNFESIAERSAKGTRPSIRRDRMPLSLSIFVRMSRVDRHDVKTMLGVLRFGGCLSLSENIYLFESVSKQDLWILSVTAKSFEECPSDGPSGDGLGEVNEEELGVEVLLEGPVVLRELDGEVKGFSVQSWSEEASESASHRPQTGQASSPSKEAEASSSLVLQNSQNVSPAMSGCGFLGLNCFLDSAGGRSPIIAGEMVP
jgi:hypothetical protein